jgi:hypothetical protein
VRFENYTEWILRVLSSETWRCAARVTDLGVSKGYVAFYSMIREIIEGGPLNP